MADSPTAVVFPQHDPAHKAHSEQWFSFNPDPGNNQHDWCTHLAIRPEVAKGLEDQVRSMVLQLGLHRSRGKPADDSDEIDRKIGIPLSTLRTDVNRPHVPLNHFLLIVRRMAKRVIHTRRPRLSRSGRPAPEEGDASPRRTRGMGGSSSSQRGVKRKAVDDDPDPESEYIDVAEEDDSEDASSDASSEAVVAVEPPTTTTTTALEVTRRTRAVPDTPPASIDGRVHPAKIDAKNIWLEITDPEEETNVFQVRLSRLSQDDVDIESCANVELNKLLELIREREKFAAWPFFDRTKQYLSWTMNGKKVNCFWSDPFQYACQFQIQESLRRDPNVLPKLVFECLPRPPKLKPSSQMNHREPPPKAHIHPSAAAAAAGPPTEPLSPASTAIMIPAMTTDHSQRAQHGPSQTPSPSVATTSPTTSLRGPPPRPPGESSSSSQTAMPPMGAARGSYENDAHRSGLPAEPREVVVHSPRSDAAASPSRHQRSNSSSSQGSGPMTIVKGESDDDEAIIIRPAPRFGHRHHRTRSERLPIPP